MPTDGHYTSFDSSSIENTTKHGYVVETTTGKSDDLFSIKFDGVPSVEYAVHLVWSSRRRGSYACCRLMLKVIIKPFEQSKRFTEELRAYAIGSRTIANLRLQVGQKEDVCVVVRFPEDAMPPPCMPVPTLKRAPKVPVWNAVVPNCNLPEPKNTVASTST